MTPPPFLDYDFHPDEPDVRRFAIPDTGVLVDTDALVTQIEESGIVLRHFAWTDRWYKLNVTYDLAGTLIETGPHDPSFAVNCDISTPMLRLPGGVAAVDLFIDVLVRDDLRGYRVVDMDEFEDAARDGLISADEARQALAGLDGFERFVASGDLGELLAGFGPDVAALAPPAIPMERIPLSEVPVVRGGRRPTWLTEGPATPPPPAS